MRQINLLPQNLQKAIHVKKIRNSVLIIFVPVFFFIAVVHFSMGFWTGCLRSTADAPPSMRETPEIVKLREELVKMNGQVQSFTAENESILEILKEDYPVSKILKTAGEAAKEKAWIKGITFDAKEGVCRIDGASFNTKAVSEFMLELKKEPYFKTVELINMGKENTGKVDKIDFQLSCFLK